MAVDGNNNVIVTGYSSGSGSSYDYATIKYSSAGVPLWTNRYNGPGNGSDYAGRRGGGRQRQRDRDGVFDWQRQADTDYFATDEIHRVPPVMTGSN